MNYPVYGNNNQYYSQNMQSLQEMKDRIENQMRQIQQQSQMQQPMQPITQNFQLAPQQNNNNELESKYVDNIEEVKNTFVMKTGIFINKDYSTLWIKDVTGNIKAFKIEEIIELDEKDREILDLQKQVNELKGMIANELRNTDVDEQTTTKKSTRVSTNKSSNAK